MAEQTTLPQQATAHALRRFIVTPALWTLYNPVALPASAIFTGYALMAGVTEAQIAYIVSIAGFVGLWQMVGFYIGRGVRNRPRFVLMLGVVEITAGCATILAYYLPAEYRVYGIVGCLVAAYVIGNTISPMYNNWLSNVLPASEQGPFMGRQMAATTIVGIAHLAAAGWLIDATDESYTGFAVIWVVAWLAGIGGYISLSSTPYPPVELDTEEGGYGRSALAPFRTPAFLRLCIYLVARLVPLQMAGAFYNIYMINYLDLGYTWIAGYTNLTLFFMTIGYLAFGALSQRYGSKPLLEMLAIPVIGINVLWALTTRENAGWLLPILFTVNGLCWSGIFVGTANLLFKIVPRGKENSAYFATWMAVAALASGVGPALGGYLRQALPEQLTIAGLSLNPIQVIFMVAAVFYVVAFLSSTSLKEDEAASPGYVLGQFRGNLLSYAFNTAVYMVAKQDETRAEAIRGMGRSGSPLALGRLLEALGHVSHKVRAEAARGIGDGRFADAVDPLIRTLEDEESDIRPEAAEALGKIGHGAGIGPLLHALSDPDVRVRTAAISALGYIRTPEASEALLEQLNGAYDANVFPVLADAAARHDDLRAIDPALHGLRRLRLPVVRLQVINAICRLLGERNHFYQIATAGTLQRAAIRESMISRIRRLLQTSELRDWELYSEAMETVEQAIAALAEDRVSAFLEHAHTLASLIGGRRGNPPKSQAASYAITEYLEHAPQELLGSEGVVFVTVALTSLARHLPRYSRVAK